MTKYGSGTTRYVCMYVCMYVYVCMHACMHACILLYTAAMGAVALTSPGMASLSKQNKIESLSILF